MPLKPSYLLLAGAGAIVAVAGVKGWGIGQTFRDVIAGKNPSLHPTLANQISGTPLGNLLGQKGQGTLNVPPGSELPGGTAGGTYTFAQLRNYWLLAGGPPDQADTAAAIALAESSGEANNTNPTDNNGTQTSWGLWQISLGNHNPPDPNWNNPLVNARLAVAKYRENGNSFSPEWGTYDTGAYLQYMPH